METITDHEVMELSLEKVIETKLVQNNVTETLLATLKEKYGGMTLKALGDKESYLELKAAAKDCAKVRTLTVKLCTEGREDAVKAQKLWIAKQKEIVGKVAEVEDALDAEIQKFDDEVNRKVAEEKQRQEEAYINRQATLTKMGAVYQGGCFVLGEASFESELVKGMDDEIWSESVVPKFQAEFEKIESGRLEQERKVQEERAEFQRQQEVMRRREEELAAREENMRREQQQRDEEERQKHSKELETMREKQEAQNKSRMNQLMALGMKYNFDDKAFSVHGVFAAQLEVTTFTDDQWDELISKITPVIAERKAEALRLEEEKKQADIEAARQEGIKKEQERQAETARLAEVARQQEEARKAEEMAQSKDKDKWEDFISMVKAVNIHEMRSGQYRRKMQVAKEYIDKILSL